MGLIFEVIYVPKLAAEMHISLVDILLQNPLTYRRKDGNIHHAKRHRKQRNLEENTMKEIKIFEQAMHEDNEFFRTH